VNALKFEELKEMLTNSVLSRRSNDHMIRTYLEVEVINEDGERIFKRRYRSKSWTKNMITVLLALMNNQKPTFVGDNYCNDNNSGYYTAITINDYNIPLKTLFNVLAPEGNSCYGIVVGTGTGTINLDSYVPIRPVGEGSLHYGPTTLTPPYSISGGWEFSINRQITNTTQNPMTISEFMLMLDYHGNFTWNLQALLNSDVFWMILHDVLSNPPTVPSNSALNTKYLFDFLV